MNGLILSATHCAYDSNPQQWGPLQCACVYSRARFTVYIATTIISRINRRS